MKGTTVDDEVIRVGLVDDQQLVRAGFRMVIDSQADPDHLVVHGCSLHRSGPLVGVGSWARTR